MSVLVQEWHAAVNLPSLIPLDAPNHDDWNVLFNDSAKLEDKLILNDGCKFFTSGPAENELFNDFADLEDKLIFSDDCKFFTSDPVERFGVFAQSGLDWKFARSKHRELHSMWCLFTSAHLFWFLHIHVFELSMSWVARDDVLISVVCFCFKGMHSSCPVLVLLWQ